MNTIPTLIDDFHYLIDSYVASIILLPCTPCNKSAIMNDENNGFK